jgi:hypothetical protein
VAAKYGEAIEKELAELERVMASDLAEFNTKMASAGLPAVHA